ncbi:MAG: endonuclease V [Methanomicrobiales archaeon]|nr:endonuclease V [Methanomicrobiales archaeon]
MPGPILIRTPAEPVVEDSVSDQIDEALEEQRKIRDRIILNRTIQTGQIHSIAGGDAAYMDDRAIGAVTVMSIPEGDLLCSSWSFSANIFPYIPGLFAFREGNAILTAIRGLSCDFQMIIFHGHGYAHPRRSGLASHLGVLLDKPSIGIADHLIVGEAEIPGEERGALSPVRDGKEVIGMAVRTRAHSRPVYVSVGHRTDLEQAVEVVLATTGTHRLPDPVWMADRLARRHRIEIERRGKPVY